MAGIVVSVWGYLEVLLRSHRAALTSMLFPMESKPSLMGPRARKTVMGDGTQPQCHGSVVVFLMETRHAVRRVRA